MANKLSLWFKHYTDETNPDTFMNGTGSSKAAKYRCKTELAFAVIGSQNLRKLKDKISKWLDEVGLSENRLKLKLNSLMEAKETKFFQKDGMITDQVDVEAIETQRRTLDMAFKIKGLYEKHNRQQSVIINPPAINKPEDSGQ